MKVKMVGKGIVSKIAMCRQCGWRFEEFYGDANEEAKHHAKFYEGHSVTVQTVTSTTYKKGQENE